ncbi:MAG TPA: hypothetical protein VK821_20275 [Dehalococcoidia bacterium]|nr:hypothetical protein [Dehalococcoidia bacterium]
MPLQNRVDPFGEVVRTPARGNLMGNRGGCFHDAGQELTQSRWKSRRWIACLLEFRGRRRVVMQPRRYTELFFLDEATALAAGHRPCAQCRWADFNRFKTAWLVGNADRGVDPGDSIDEIDVHLQHERVDRRGRKLTSRAMTDALPDGSMVALDESPQTARIIWGDRLLAWSFEGYGEPLPRSGGLEVTLLTPVSIVRAVVAGYRPAVHASLAM